MLKSNSLLTFLALLFSASLLASQPFTLKLKSGDLLLNESNRNASLTDFKLENSTDYAIIQFYQIPTEAEKTMLSQNGLSLLEYLPNKAFISRVASSSASYQQLGIRSAVPYLANYKTSSAFKNDPAPEWAFYEGGQLQLMVEPHLDVNPEIFKNELLQLGAEIDKEDASLSFYEIRVSSASLNAIIENELVKFVDYIPAPPEKEDTEGRSLHRGNMLDSDHPLGRKYDGTGVSIAIADDGLIGPHIDYSGRVTQFTNVDRGTHGDMTSGIAMGAGNLDPSIKGMATGAFLYYYDIGGYPHVGNAVSNLTTRGVVITSTSYSEGCNAGYTATTRVVDQQTRLYPELLHVFSAGNSANSTCGGNAYGAGRPWGTITGGRKQGKAVIATGNLDYLGNLTNSSSRGPAADGRIKPDICANGTQQLSTDPNNNYRPGGGTSAAAPGIAGLAAQLYHGYRDNNGGVDPESGLIKAAMLNTARDIGNPGPDFYYGWGRVNAHRAMKLVEENRYLSGSVSQNGSNTHTITTATALEELRVMVYWTDYEASTTSAQSLVNNIDFKLVAPNNDTILPWVLDPTPNAVNLARNAVRGVDNLNNMEQVTRNNAVAGNYTVLIDGTSIPQGPQSYFVVWETKPNEIEVTYPSGGESFVPNRTETIRWDAFGNTGNFSIEFSSDSGSTWSTISSSVPGNRRYYDWNVPIVTTGDALVRVSRSGVSDVSDHTFTSMGIPLGIGASFVCADSVNLTWSAVPGATEYEISVLGNQYMDSIGRSTTTEFRIYGLTLSNDNWVSVKAIGPKMTGRRANAILLPKTELNCPYDYDFRITQIEEPREAYTVDCIQDKIPVRVTITNNGDSVLQDVPLRLIANGTTYFDTIRGNLNAGAFQFFTFRDSMSVGIGNQLSFNVQGDYPNDANPDNDSIVGSIDIFTSQLESLPYTQDFETFSNCATTNNCGSTNCNLPAGWTNVSNSIDDHDLRVNSGGTPSAGTGPSFDQNPGTTLGKYLYSEASNGCVGAESQTITPCFDLSNTIAPEMSFWYHMQGNDVGVLRVDVLKEGRWDINRINLFGNQGAAWLEQTFDLSPYIGETVSFRIKVITGGGWSSDIAIDNFNVEDLGVGIDEVAARAFKIYPNPSAGIFQVEFVEGTSRNIQLFDLQGRIIKELRSDERTTTIDLSEMDSGIYLLGVEGSSKREKLIIY